MKCRYCGGEVEQGDAFCMNCGNRIEIAEANDIMPVAPMPEKKNKKTAIIIAVAVVAVVIVAAIAVFVGYSMGQSNNNDTVENSSVSQHEAESSRDEVSSAENTTFNLVSDIEMTTTETTTEEKSIPVFTYDDEKADFLFDSENVYITEEYLSGCTRDEVLIIINEIYARHGYIFKDAELSEYFNSQSWYNGTETSMTEVAESFNAIEQKNIDTIYAYQVSMGWR